MCYSKFRSSDGRGGEGDLGDCGYYDPLDPPTDCATAVPLWGSAAALCSGEQAGDACPCFQEKRPNSMNISTTLSCTSQRATLICSCV